MTEGMTIHSKISEEEYRRALQYVFKNKKRDLIVIGCVIALIADIAFFIKALVTEDRLDFLLLLLVGVFIYLIVKLIRIPKMAEENAFKKLKERTGKTDLETDVTFNADEILLISYTSGDEVSISYKEVTLIREFDSFFGVYAGRKGFYMSKSDVESTTGFLDFIKEKCGDIAVLQC